MDELIKVFIDRCFTEEMKSSIYESFDIFSKYELNNIDDSLLDILTNEENISSEETQDLFISVINSKLDFILNEHTIKVIENTSISDKLQILSALLLVQDLEDYSSVIATLESLEEDYYKLANIISVLSDLDFSYVLEIVESFNPMILSKLKEYIYSKSKPDTGSCDTDILTNIKRFFNFIKTTSLGVTLIKARVELGLPFNLYFPLIKEDIISLDQKQTALNFLSVIMLSKDGQLDPIGTYRKYSLEVLHDINLVSSVEVFLINIYSSYMEYKRVEIEKVRISENSSKQ